jgi:hypothetical protein
MSQLKRSLWLQTDGSMDRARELGAPGVRGHCAVGVQDGDQQRAAHRHLPRQLLRRGRAALGPGGKQSCVKDTAP